MYKPNDFFFQKAKKEGYPARSVYKLEEIDRKYSLFQPGQAILDLGCFPGSWSLYIGRKVGPEGEVLGVDLKETSLEIDNFTFLQADIFKIKFDQLAEVMSQTGIDGGFDGLVSDMAPSTSGIKTLDAGRSAQLAERAFDLAEEFLKNDGFLVMKILEGGEHDPVWRQIKSNFKEQAQFRPKAVRRNSREIYIVADGFKRS